MVLYTFNIPVNIKKKRQKSIYIYILYRHLYAHECLYNIHTPHTGVIIKLASTLIFDRLKLSVNNFEIQKCGRYLSLCSHNFVM